MFGLAYNCPHYGDVVIFPGLRKRNPHATGLHVERGGITGIQGVGIGPISKKLHSLNNVLPLLTNNLLNYVGVDVVPQSVRS